METPTIQKIRISVAPFDIFGDGDGEQEKGDQEHPGIGSAQLYFYIQKINKQQNADHIWDIDRVFSGLWKTKTRDHSLANCQTE